MRYVHAQGEFQFGSGRLLQLEGHVPHPALPADGSTGDAWAQEPPLPTYLGGAHGTVVQLQPQGAGE